MARKNCIIQTQIGQDAARELWKIGAIMDKSRSTDGRGFRLKLHQANPDAPLSPVYVNLRLLQSYPRAMARVVSVYRHLLGREFSAPELLAGIPHAGTPITACLMMATGIPMITPRPETKTHGTGGSIDGDFKSGESVLVIDDLITKADSKVEAAQVLEASNLDIHGIMVLVDREQGGAQAMAEAGYRFAAAYTFTDLLEFYQAEGLMAQEMYDEIRAYLSGN